MATPTTYPTILLPGRVQGERAMIWIKGAEEWGNVCLVELCMGAASRGIVRSQHHREAARAARLAGRYALRFLDKVGS